MQCSWIFRIDHIMDNTRMERGCDGVCKQRVPGATKSQTRRCGPISPVGVFIITMFDFCSSFFEPNKRYVTNPQRFLQIMLGVDSRFNGRQSGSGLMKIKKSFRNHDAFPAINNDFSERLRIYRVYIRAAFLFGRKCREMNSRRTQEQDEQTYRKINSNKFRTSRDRDEIMRTGRNSRLGHFRPCAATRSSEQYLF